VTGLRLNQGDFVLDRFADKNPHAFLRAEHPAQFFQHVAQHAVGNGLAVDQHAIAVKQHRIKSHCRSPST
jgi:hypothetical protein